jgi:5-methylcytosine-specific restriction endonuclease McrA
MLARIEVDVKNCTTAKRDIPANKATTSAYSAKRRALKAGSAVGDPAATKALYRQARENKRVRCYLCGKLIPMGRRHVDHVYPLVKGGAHGGPNLAVACATCNLKKKDKLPHEIGLLL